MFFEQEMGQYCISDITLAIPFPHFEGWECGFLRTCKRTARTQGGPLVPLPTMASNAPAFLGSVSRTAAPREGSALLQSRVLCGHCGRRMSPTYTNARPSRDAPACHHYVCKKKDDRLNQLLDATKSWSRHQSAAGFPGHVVGFSTLHPRGAPASTSHGERGGST